ncbi:Oxysterol-binding protein-domain-containing protein [Crassisporium funariophilum]|nr:Oxysterol-binding protein-domain-containing protein [Crassisporium funariophilum]
MKGTKNVGHASLNLGLSTTSITTSLAHMPGPAVLLEGWVLKKRRKKMQGFARRYFTLYQSGLLSYAFEPGQPIRDQIFLHNAAISTAPGRKDIHIDSNTATFHIKCLSTDDFNNWMTAFRKFRSNGLESRKSATIRHASRQASVTLNLNRSGALVEEMGTTLVELEKSISILCQELSFSKSHVPSKKSDKNLKESRFGLFKKPHHNVAPESSGIDHQLDMRLPLPESLQGLMLSFDTLKVQHGALLKAMQTSLSDVIQPLPSSLPSTAEEEEFIEEFNQRSLTPVTRRSFRDSMGTTASDSFVEWFDAIDEGLDGPQEYILEAERGASEPGSRLLTQSPSTADNSSIDTDIEELDTSPAKTPDLVTTPFGNVQVTRRTHLPSPPASDEGSLFTILKKNVGKDLSTITFPVTFNEPLTLLQRAAEELEYYTLLDEAASATDPVVRMSYVAAFAISGYAHTRHRSGRKGFNPMLAETFEDIRMGFIAEKVCHNPLEIAYHAERANWKLSATSCGRTKFWGKSLEIIPLGITRLRIGTDDYEWKKPSTFIRNLMVGTKYFEHCGKMTIENRTTQARCILDLKQNGYWGPTNVVSGTIHDAEGDIIGQLEGKWDDQMCQMLDASHFHVLWRLTPFPKNSQEYYGFTSYGITLNELTSDLVGKLPPTDSRYRPDVRALENGELDLAETEKARLEQMQRDRRSRGEERKPSWFKQVGGEWEYTGGYWEARSRGWDMAPLW